MIQKKIQEYSMKTCLNSKIIKQKYAKTADIIRLITKNKQKHV
ncbi:MAG: hypothetical protein RHS_4321 [Robinsoniella sp. RHS]|nr:MAG: hypothetical protein RHS_4321 [Robinsoniella sp. RHS]